MPGISFSTMKDKICSGEKKQTIRPYSPFWMKWRKGDRLVGYWKMRTKDCEKLFDSTLSENPFVLYWGDFSTDLMQLDGFEGVEDANKRWFIPHYGSKQGGVYIMMLFVVLRWK